MFATTAWPIYGTWGIVESLSSTPVKNTRIRHVHDMQRYHHSIPLRQREIARFIDLGDLLGFTALLFWRHDNYKLQYYLKFHGWDCKAFGVIVSTQKFPRKSLVGRGYVPAC